MNPDMMGMMMQLMPLMQTLSGSRVSLRDIISGKGRGAALRAQLLMSVPGSAEAKAGILRVLELADQQARVRKLDLLDVLIGSSSDKTLSDELKKGLRTL